MNSTEIFDPATGAFSAGPNLNSARAGHSATLLSDGKVLIAGGDADGSAEIFEPAAGNFSSVATNMLTPRALHSAALMNDGNVLLVARRCRRW